MEVKEKIFNVQTTRRAEMIDITGQVGSIVRSAGVKTGEVLVFCPHTTAAITINENADPDVQHDMLLTLDEMFPQNRAGYRHSEGNSDAHIKSSLIGCSERIPVTDKHLMLGTWQGIYFCEFDGPRNRKVFVQVVDKDS
ncbi:secondary thiamine-phosphate synthase enzyme [Limihaloglobus sulfuriphilus]|uniref:Secondary thiamine-phosphate synthase enzyme n=1 Tax=Limihaloglobus sulfuriphilus TaxID=1851148 RepID=A0A1Q2MAW9_9BACT|nr:secondary thiamine-phosphate synthase enzyme YjbQ [Limihaloglobus sulfuriphilus]AQQ69809.1 secondary thiamine-phosphate synthase enzyme [Limihaloglobus sulfuriphilus]